MEADESLPIMKLTRGSKRNVFLTSVILGAAFSVFTYKSMIRILDDTLESVGVLLYDELGVVLKKNR